MRLYILSECEGGDIPSLLLKDVFSKQKKYRNRYHILNSIFIMH